MRWLPPIPGLTNFSLREADLELRHGFRLPPNIYDGFETSQVATLMWVVRDSESGLAALGQQIEANWDCP